MGRENRIPKEIERRAKICERLQASNVSSMSDIWIIFKEALAKFMGNRLDAELDDGKYDCLNQDTDNI
ncbi:MAG: hypothetical protein RR893_07590 [Clostridia bacterium]